MTVLRQVQLKCKVLQWAADWKEKSIKWDRREWDDRAVDGASVTGHCSPLDPSPLIVMKILIIIPIRLDLIMTMLVHKMYDVT